MNSKLVRLLEESNELIAEQRRQLKKYEAELSKILMNVRYDVSEIDRVLPYIEYELEQMERPNQVDEMGMAKAQAELEMERT